MTKHQDNRRTREADWRLLDKPIWQMTGEEFFSLLRKTLSETSKAGHTRRVAHGLTELGAHLGCGRTQTVKLNRLGVFDKAVISSVGRKKLYDVDTALQSALEYVKSASKKYDDYGQKH